MRNIRKFCIAIFVLTIIYYVRASETETTDISNGIQLRVQRNIKKSESESVKKQKQQQQQEESESVARFQLARSQNNAGSSANDLAAIQTNLDPLRNVLRNVPIQVNQVKQMDNPFNTGGMPSYAYNFPYQRQAQPSFSPLGNPGYFYGNPNMPSNPLDQANNNLFTQQSYPNGYAPNFAGYGVGQPGLPQLGQLPYPPPYGSNLLSLGPYGPYGQPGLPYSPGADFNQFTRPSDFPNIFGQQASLTGNNFIGYGSLPGDVSNGGFFSPVTQLQQPSILSSLFGMLPFGAPTQNGLNSGFVASGGLLPEFIRNRRSLEAKD